MPQGVLPGETAAAVLQRRVAGKKRSLRVQDREQGAGARHARIEILEIAGQHGDRGHAGKSARGGGAPAAKREDGTGFARKRGADNLANIASSIAFDMLLV